MGTKLIAVVGILVSLRNLSQTVIGNCMFGENCDYPCHCQNNAVCNPLDGSCPTGCDDGDLYDTNDYWYTGAWTGYGCQIGNVAYDKTGDQGPVTEYPAEKAIDGSHDPRLASGHCAWVSGGSTADPAWWQVDLGQTYVIISVNITNSNTEQGRSTFMDITVGSERDNVSLYQVCNTINEEGAADTIYVVCDPNRLGRFVRIQRHAYGYQSDSMNVCEIQVFGYLFHDCPEGYFGVACGTPCNCRGPCDNIYGVCTTQNCLEGWIGADCQTVCSSGTWGDNCQERCYCEDNMENCNHVNGSCISGCKVGYGGVGCNIVQREAKSAISMIVSLVLACAIGIILIIVFVILLRRYRDQTDMSPTNGDLSNSKRATENGANPVYESIEEESVSTVSNDHKYENQTPSGRPPHIDGLRTNTGEIYDNAFVEEFEQNRTGVPEKSTKEGYENVTPIVRERDVDTKYETIERGAALLSGTSDPIYDN